MGTVPLKTNEAHDVSHWQKELTDFTTAITTEVGNMKTEGAPCVLEITSGAKITESLIDTKPEEVFSHLIVLLEALDYDPDTALVSSEIKDEKRILTFRFPGPRGDETLTVGWHR